MSWRPTDNQRRALEYARETVWDFSVTDLAEDVGINRRTYYKWFETAHFRRWWQEQWDRFFAPKMGKLWAKLFAAACGENNNCSAQHAKLIIARFDRGPAPNGKNGNGNGKDNGKESKPPVKTYINVDVERVTKRER